MPASRVNDFVLKIATVNGTGSASANTLLMKSIFRSGIPVMGKNYFPSNIQGLPTWYEIRISVASKARVRPRPRGTSAGCLIHPMRQRDRNPATRRRGQ